MADVGVFIVILVLQWMAVRVIAGLVVNSVVIVTVGTLSSSSCRSSCGCRGRR